MHLKYQMACVTETMAALIAKAAASVPDIVCTYVGEHSYYYNGHIF
jgi:hypothetical protein